MPEDLAIVPGGRLRIAHVITRFVRGGADENTLYSCNAQAEIGHDVHLLFGAENHPDILTKLHPAVGRYQIPHLVREIDLRKDLLAVAEMRKIFSRLDPDIVHTHTSKAGALGRVAALISGQSAIVHGVHILPFLNVGAGAKAVYLGVERMLAPFTKVFVNVSHGMQAEGISHRVGRPDQHVVVPSGMDTAKFATAQAFSSNELAEALGTSAEDAAGFKIILMTAALERRKRQYEFLDVLGEVLENDPKAFLVLAGDGVDRQRITERGDELGLSHRMAIIGFRSDVERWMASAAVCVLASEREGLPRAVIQYVLAGRPVVSTALPGVDAIVRSGENGFLVDTDLSHMAERIGTILVDPDVANRMGGAARRVDLSAWSVENMAAGLELAYARAVQNKPRTRGRTVVSAHRGRALL